MMAVRGVGAGVMMVRWVRRGGKSCWFEGYVRRGLEMVLQSRSRARDEGTVTVKYEAID